MSLPVNFEERVKQAPAANGTGYPYRISAGDLMRNFNYLDQKEGLPDPPSGSGTYVLGCVDGVIQWLETEGCDSESGTP